MNHITTVPSSDEQLRTEVQKRYAKTALQVLGATHEAEADACCDTSCCTPGAERETHTKTIAQIVPAEQASICCGPNCRSTGDGSLVTADLYSEAELGTIPGAAALASLGWRVLDLGSGGGIDVLLSARRVGSNGFAYGLDMTDAMLELAERNWAEAGIENVRFLKGYNL